MNKIIEKLKAISVITLLLFSNPLTAAEFSIFGSVALQDSSIDDEETSFLLGGLDFYGSAQIDDQTRAFFEYVFENTGDGLITDLERIWVAREFSTGFTLGAGRFHSPLGYWNRTFHHGTFMQDTVSRPFFLDFEDGAAGVLPVHVVGLMAWGDISGKLSYEAFIGNGPSVNTGEYGLGATPDGKPEIDINDAGDSNSDKSIGFRLTYQATDDMATSLFMATHTVGESGDGTGGSELTAFGEDLVSQTITGVDMQYFKGDFEVFLEYFNFSNDDEVDNINGNQDSHTGTAYYLQLGYYFQIQTKAIIRYESLAFDDDDVYFSILGAFEATNSVVAFRHNLSDTNAITLEFSRLDPDEGDAEDFTTLQWSFMIP